MKRIAVGILAHVDAGKTTLAEAILYNAGVIRNPGRVDHRDTVLDSHSLEKDRGITIFAGEAVLKTGDTHITLLDTPGHIDFSAETERVLGVLDYAILVISATDGVQSHTRTVWELLREYSVPTFIFVTKCDLKRRSKYDILNELENEFGSVIDFCEGYECGENLEKIAMCDENLLTEYLTYNKFSTESIISAIKSRKIFPCFFGSGLKNEGVSEFISSLEKHTVSREYPASFGARVYKIAYDKNERLTKLRVMSGSLKVKDSIEYSGVSEKINQIRIYSGARYITVNEAPAGTVCAVTGLTKTFSGQGLGAETWEKAAILEPVMRYRIVLPDDCDPLVMLPKFKSLEEEDPMLSISYNGISGDFHCALMGKVQAEIFKNIVLERFDVHIEIAEGKVIYKETLCDTVEGVGHYEPLRHYAEVHLLLEPGERSSGLKFCSKCSENRLERNWQRLIMTHLAEKTHLGVLTGSPITDIKISLVNGKAHLKHTEGGDFRQATYRAVRQGLMQAKNILLEPYCRFRLEPPVRNIGRAINDIRLMGGNFDPPYNDGEISILKGKAPVVCMDGYMAEVASYTGGLGRLSLEPAGYDVCHNADKVIESYAYDPENDIENTPDSVFCSHGAGFGVKWDKVKEHMHLESCFSQNNDSAEPHRHKSFDEKLLEEIMLKEFGPQKTVLYNRKESVPDKKEASPTVLGVKTKCLIVDGYNVIFGLSTLKDMAKTDLEGARIKLCYTLSCYSVFTGCRVVIVFDGYKVEGNPGEKYDYCGINVVFTKENETADTYIERFISEIGKNEQVRVVTSDGMIQLSAVRTGVLRMSVSELERELADMDIRIREIVESINKNQA